jgi:hypothetical protein
LSSPNHAGHTCALKLLAAALGLRCAAVVGLCRAATTALPAACWSMPSVAYLEPSTNLRLRWAIELCVLACCVISVTFVVVLRLSLRDACLVSQGWWGLARPVGPD